MNIPKIIHQIAPANPNDWHPIWRECQKSWLKCHQEFYYILWNDDNDIQRLIKNHYPEYLNFYNNISHKIVKIDFAKFCILYQYGGIYADMDMFCYKNFYSTLENNLYIVESWEEWGEKVQNSLMISLPNHSFWIKCMDKCIENFKEFKLEHDYSSYVLSICGPRFISRILDPSVSILPKEIFNPKIDYQFSYSQKNYESELYKKTFDDFVRLNNNKDNVLTRHYLTSNWL